MESLETLPESLLESLKALLDSFESLKGLSLCSLDGFGSLRELLFMLLVVVMVRALVLLDPSCTEEQRSKVTAKYTQSKTNLYVRLPIYPTIVVILA